MFHFGLGDLDFSDFGLRLGGVGLGGFRFRFTPDLVAALGGELGGDFGFVVGVILV